ncbi:anti-sigma factor [Halalkalibacter urbisdiaboli]|uniref:anti-sigma factor n=1 Tax=Halalkalibacter urbisdiaboli TaxID=1960589 RepID=UPI000B44EB69|nr:anti-sigma factor [Halalkalibacter urbisdiaboli]
MTCKHGITEENIVDFIKGHYNQVNIQEHLHYCEECQGLYAEWSVRLRTLEEPSTIPSEHLKKRVMQVALKKSEKGFNLFKQAYIVSFTFALLILALGISIVNLKDGNQAESIVLEPFMIQEETDLYEILAEYNDNVKGYAWVNPESNEMLLLVDGLHPISLQDYQAWLQTSNETKNVGVLKVSGQTGQLYIQDGMIHNLKQIMVSKEPIGGSSQPTDPNPVFIRLNSK